MAKNDVRVETDAREVRILRDPREAQRLGCSPVTVIPIGDVVRATSVPGPSGSRYLRVEATRAQLQADPERDPLVVRFDRRQAGEAERLAGMIQRNSMVAASTAPPVGPTLLEQNPNLGRTLNRAATLSMWSAGITLAMLLVPVVAVIIVVVVLML